MRPRGIVVAIDGPAGAGKSTVSRTLARRLGYVYVDTGAMYRVVGWLACAEGIAADDAPALEAIAREVRIHFELRPDGTQGVFAGDQDLTREIRREDIGEWASKVSALPSVRALLVTRQRELGQDGGVVLEGRDIGTVVFPDAEAKFYLDASADARARRRHGELAARGHAVAIESLREEMQRRDERDSSRQHSPLRRADDAEWVDTTGRSVEEVLEHLERRCRETARAE